MNEYSSGDTELLATDVNIMLNGARIFKFNKFETNDGLTDVTIADRVKAVAFPASGTPRGTLKLDLRNFDLTKDIFFVATYCMSTAVAGTNKVKLQNSYKVYNDTNDLTSFSVTTNTEEFTVLTTARTKTNQIFTTLKIPYTAFSNINDFIIFDISRLNSGLSGTNHTGDFELISFIAFQ